MKKITDFFSHPITYFIGAMTIMFIVLLWFAFHVIDVNASIKSIVDQKMDSIRHSQSKSGRDIAMNKAIEAPMKMVIQSDPELLKQIKDMNGQISDMKAFISLTIKAQGTITTSVDTIHVYDTIRHTWAKRHSFQTDGYLSQDLYWNDQKIESDYAYSDSLISGFENKRPNRFKRKELYVVTSLRNPKAKIVNQTGVLVPIHKKHFVISAGATVTPAFVVNPSWQNVPVGIQVGYKLYEF